jgi:hypothetical protein
MLTPILDKTIKGLVWIIQGYSIREAFSALLHILLQR